MSEQTNEASDTFGGTIELVSAYVSNANNRLSADDLQALIRATFVTLSNLSTEPSSSEEADDYTKSKAEIRKSIRPDSLISFIDGKPYQALKRHLTTQGYTPETYRATFGLPDDYPLVHPGYSARRSELAKKMGLGQKGLQARRTGKKARAAKPAE